MGRVSRCKLVDKVAKGMNNSAVDFEWGKWVVEMEAELCCRWIGGNIEAGLKI